MTDEKEKINLSALFRIGYGLYVLTTNDGKKDNGCIVNSVMQVTSNPLRVAVCVNKQNYSCGTILETLKMNVNCLSVSKDSVSKAAEPSISFSEKRRKGAKTGLS